MNPETPDPLRRNRHRIARVAIVIYLVTFFAATLTLCSCPGFFVVMAMCALVAFFSGSRPQRFISLGLLLAAGAGFYLQLQQEARVAEHARRARDIQQQRLREQR